MLGWNWSVRNIKLVPESAHLFTKASLLFPQMALFRTLCAGSVQESQAYQEPTGS